MPPRTENFLPYQPLCRLLAGGAHSSPGAEVQTPTEFTFGFAASTQWSSGEVTEVLILVTLAWTSEARVVTGQCPASATQ